MRIWQSFPSHGHDRPRLDCPSTLRMDTQNGRLMANIKQNAVLTGKLNDVRGFFRWPECEFSRGKARQDVSLRLKSSGSRITPHAPLASESSAGVSPKSAVIRITCFSWHNRIDRSRVSPASGLGRNADPGGRCFMTEECKE